MGDARGLIDEAVARTIAYGSAWIRQTVQADDGAGGAGLVRLEGEADLRRRICVAIEAVLPSAESPRLTGGRGRAAPAADAGAGAFASRRVVYAGGSRYVAGGGGWAHVAGEIEGPRRPSDPLWLLDALGYAVDCAGDGRGEVGGRLDLAAAEGIDRTAIVPAAGRRRAFRRRGRRERREREAWLARVPCVVAIGGEGAIASMAFAALPPDPGGGLLWATTEFVQYGVPVQVPDLMARTPAGREADRLAPPCLTRSSGRSAR